MNVPGYNMTLLLLLLALIPLLFPLVKSSVYYIKPLDQNVNVTANTLDYYLQNAMKYFVSNTHLLFLPGVYQLNTVINIYNVYNFSLIGINTNNDSVVIQCLSTGGIAIINSSYISMNHLIVKDCRSEFPENSVPGRVINNNYHASLLIKDSHSIKMHQLSLLKTQSYSILLINVLSDSTISEVSSSGMLIVYNNHETVQKSEHNLTIIKFHPMSTTDCSKFLGRCYKIEFLLLDHIYHINVNILETTFNTEDAIFIETQTCYGFNKITILNCNFTNIRSTSTDIELEAIIEMHFTSCNEPYFVNKQMNQIDILKCHFSNNINYKGNRDRYVMIIQKVWYSYNGVIIYIRDSEIFENKNIAFLISKFIDGDLPLKPINITINNTSFVCIDLESQSPLLDLYGVSLQLEGPIVFTEFNRPIILGDKTHVYASGYIEFSNINALFIVQSTRFYLNTNTLLNFTSNKAFSLFERDDDANLLYPPCLLQYNMGNKVHALSDVNISIIVDNSEFSRFCKNKYCTSHCSWENNVFNEIAPLDINRKFIKNLHNNSTLITDRKFTCYCFKDNIYDCYIDEINPVYPGQIIHLGLMNTVGVGSYISITVYTGLPTSCRIGKNSELVQLIHNNCTKLRFTIQSNKKWCELFLSYSPTDVAIFYVKFLPCPPGFNLNELEGYCQCDPLLTSTNIISITSCNIIVQRHSAKNWAFCVFCETIMKLST